MPSLFWRDSALIGDIRDERNTAIPNRRNSHIALLPYDGESKIIIKAVTVDQGLSDCDSLCI
ncbi:hypothetical protein NC997_23040 [Trichocoleus sp. DQ-A2]|uniref:hypothetical protein n=1 Tax=Cyanophyceae TaxID=3028117 RepID=UPI00168A0B83|nr:MULTISPECIES: hypothetical protein [unclassified Coleofasciculus]MBD1880202.1 hypothetical protein [Coleofasciculus sp. FACHB-T130]MBD1895702.1 hypothetical protein [Coleofasciculus sp. FACHB-129]MBD1900486.1 hypothetical protein [Coleofasciculus sp. FACHB-125]